MTRKIWSKSIRKALAVTLCVTMTVPSNIAYAAETSGGGYEEQERSGLIELTDEDIENLYQKVNFQRQSVHDPSITVAEDGTYYVFGSHMGVAKTNDLQNWSSTAISDQNESNAYYGVRKTETSGVSEKGLVKSFNFSDGGADFTMQGSAAVVANPDDENDKVLCIETGSGGKNGNYAITPADYFSDVDFSNGVTVSMNVRPTTNNSEWNYLFSIGTTASPVTNSFLYVDGTIGFIQRAGDPYAAYFPNDGWVEGNAINNNSGYFTDEANSSKWHKLTYVYSATEVSIYVDGVLTVRQTPQASLGETVLPNLNNGTELVLGAGASRGDFENFGGYIDDVFVYNTALTAAEVEAIPAKADNEKARNANSRTADEKVIPVSYKNAFKSGAYGIKEVQTIDGNTVKVDFSKFPAGDWNTAVSTNPDSNGNTSQWQITGNMWAPDIIYNPVMKKWCMYLSLNGNVWNSVVILLTADTIEGPYVYEAPIIYSGFTDGGITDYKKTDLSLVLNNGQSLNSLPARYNNLITNVDSNGTATSSAHGSYGTYWPHAIDPCVFYDDEGNLWLGYGSWSGGIYVIQLDEETGLRDYTVEYKYEANGVALNEDAKNANVTSDPYFGKKIAGGYYVSGEGSYIEKIGNKYCLFMSYGFYSPEGGYEMRIFYSDTPDGPYVDTAGISAIYSGYAMNYSAASTTNRGQKLMGNYLWPDYMDVAEIAQGHNSAFVDSKDGRAYVIYHTKFNDGTAGHQLRVHELFTTKSGYLVASPYENSVNNQKITENMSYSTEQLVGSYDVIVHKYKTKCLDKDQETEVITPVKVTLNSDNTVTGEMTGTWSNETGTPYATITLNGKTYLGVFVEQNITGSTASTMCFTILDESTGLCVWGSKEIADDIAVAKNVVNFKSSLADTAYTDLDLSVNTTDNITVTWSSSNTNVITNDGVVTATDKDVEVTMTAKIVKGNYYYNKQYQITVKAGGITNADCETGLEAFYDFEGNLINKLNSSQIGEALVQTSGTIPQYEYDEKRGNKVWHQYFGVNDTQSISYTRFLNPLKGQNLEGATVSLWVNRLDGNVWDTIWSFLDTGNSVGGGRLYLTPNAYLGYNSGTDPVKFFDCNHPDNVTNTIEKQEWNLLTTTIDKNGFGIYINGKLVYTQNKYVTLGSSSNIVSLCAEVVNLLSSADDFYLGYGSFWGSAPLLMDNLKIYNRALSEADVAKLYKEEASETKGVNEYFYFENYNNTSNVKDVWSSINAADNLLLKVDSSGKYGSYVEFSPGNANSRSAYTLFNLSDLSDKYLVEFDTKLTAGNNQDSQLALTTADYTYKGNDKITNGYIWEMSTIPNGTTWTISNGDTVTIPKGTWVHISTDVSKIDGVAKIKITNGDEVLYNGTVICKSKADVKGIYVLSGRYYGVMCFDNVKVQTSLADGMIGEYLFAQDSLADSLNPDAYKAEIKYASEDTKSQIVQEGNRGSVMEMKGTFQATGYLELNTDYLDFIQNAITVSMWAKANNSKASDSVCGAGASLFNFKTTEDVWVEGENAYRPGFVSLDVSLSPFINDYYGNYVNRTTETVELSDSKWQQITMSIDAVQNQISIYVDGVLAQKLTLNGGTCEALIASIKEHITAIQIGTCLPWWNVWDFRGYVDDVRLYNKVLTAGEVARLYTLSADESVVIKPNRAKYTISFDANEGNGAMASMDCEAGTSYILSENEFTREGYSFEGWSLTSDGTVDYDDMASVSDLTKIDGETIILYAVWKDVKAPQIITFEEMENTLTTSGVSVQIESDETGIYYFIYNKATDDTLKNAEDLSTAVIEAVGQGTEMTDTKEIIEIKDLEPGTLYNAYLVIKDTIGNISECSILSIQTPQEMIAVNASIFGTKEYASQLGVSAQNGKNAPMTYQWYRSDEPITENTAINSLDKISDISSTSYILQKEDVGKYIAVGISIDSEQYSGYTIVCTDAIVQPKDVTAAVQVSDKTYDGTTTAEVSKITLAGIEDGDSVTASASAAEFADKNAGENKTVSISGITLSGDDASAYKLTPSTAEAQASISKKSVSIKSATVEGKTYDGATTANVTAVEFEGAVEGEVLEYTASAEFTDANAGAEKTVSGTVTLTGSVADNYELSDNAISVTAKIEKAEPEIEAPSGVTAPYNTTLKEITLPESFAFDTADLEEGLLTKVGDVGTRTFKVIYTPKDSNYKSVTIDISIEVTKASLSAPVLSGTDETIDGKKDGKINGLEIGMEYSTDDANYTPVTDANINSSFAPGTYYVRYMENENHFVSQSTQIVIAAGSKLMVTFIADDTIVKEVAVSWNETITDIPEVPAKEGYTQTAPKWDAEDFTNIQTGMEVHAVYTINKYTVTLTQGEGYTLKITGSEENTSIIEYLGTCSFKLILADGYSKTEAFAVKANENVLEPDADGNYSLADIAENQVITVEGVADITLPTGEIKVADHTWNTRFELTSIFNLFFKDIQTVTITAGDKGSGVDKIFYYLSKEPLTADIVDWTEYTDVFNIMPNDEYVIYAKIIDKAGNCTYINSEGMILDNIVPVIMVQTASGFSAVFDKVEYQKAQTFKVEENYLKQVTVNGAQVSLSEEGTFVLKVSDDSYTIEAEDKAGNKISYNISIGRAAGTGSVAIEGWTYGEEANQPVVMDTNNAGYTVTYYKGSEELKEVPKDAGEYTVKVTFNQTDETAEYVSSADFVIAKAAQDMPLIEKTDETIYNKADGTIKGLTAAMEYSTDETNYTTVADSKMLFAAGTYYVRLKGDNNYLSSPAAKVVIEAGRKLKVTFKADNTVVEVKEAGWNEEITDIPEIPEKEGYDQTAPKWDKTDFKKIQSDMTVQAVYTINQYTVTLEQGEGYTLKLTDSEENASKADYLGSISFHLTVADGYSKTDDFAVKADKAVLTVDENGAYSLTNIAKDYTITVEGIADIEAPTGEIRVKESIWNTGFSPAVWNLFFNASQTVTITAKDMGSGIAEVSYYLSDTPLTVDNVSWTVYKEPFVLALNNKYIVYARLLDKAGNYTYINSDGMVLDGIVPAVTVQNANGFTVISDGAEYEKTRTFKVTDDYLNKVSVNNEQISLSEEGTFVLKPSNDKYVITAEDKAGNQASYTITVKKAKGAGSVAAQGWIYGEKANEPEIIDTNNTGYTIVYYKDSEKLETAPVDAGDYTVTVVFKETDDYEEYTASSDYTISRAEIAAPSLEKTDETVRGKNDGTISGLTAQMEYSRDGAVYTDVSENTGNITETVTLTGLEPGTYYVRYKADENHSALVTTIIIQEGIAEEPTTEEPTTEEPTTEEPTTEEPITDEPTTEEPTTEEPTTEEPITEEPTTEEPTTEEPTTEEPTTEEPATEEPTTEEPTTEEPITEEPTTEEPATNPDLSGGIPQIKGENGKTGWQVIGDEIRQIITENLPQAKVDVQMNGSTQLPRDIIREIKGKDIQLELDMGAGITWTIDGMTVTGESFRDISMEVILDTDNIPSNVLTRVTSGKTSKNITLVHEGEFGFTPVLTINVGRENSSFMAKLYYYNKRTRAMELSDSGRVDGSGNARFTFTHASEYTIVIDKADSEEPPTADNSAKLPVTGDSQEDIWNRTWLIMIASMLVIAGAGSFSMKKRKK